MEFSDNLPPYDEIEGKIFWPYKLDPNLRAPSTIAYVVHGTNQIVYAHESSNPSNYVTLPNPDFLGMLNRSFCVSGGGQVLLHDIEMTVIPKPVEVATELYINNDNREICGRRELHRQPVFSMIYSSERPHIEVGEYQSQHHRKEIGPLELYLCLWDKNGQVALTYDIKVVLPKLITSESAAIAKAIDYHLESGNIPAFTNLIKPLLPYLNTDVRGLDGLMQLLQWRLEDGSDPFRAVPELRWWYEATLDSLQVRLKEHAYEAILAYASHGN